MIYDKGKLDAEYSLSLDLYNGEVDVFRGEINNKKIFKKTKYIKNYIKPALDRRTSLLLYTYNNNRDFNLDIEEDCEFLKDKIETVLFKNNFGETLTRLAKYTNIYGNMLLKIYKTESDNHLKIKLQDFKCVKNIDKDSMGRIVYLELEYTEEKYNGEVTYYTEIYTPEKTIIKINDKEEEFKGYGFVPFIHFKNTEDIYGTPISREVWEIIKYINELDSLARINIKTLIDRIFFATAEDKTAQDNLKMSIYKSKDAESKMWFGDTNTKIQEIKPTEIPQTFLDYTKDLKGYIDTVLPEYCMDQIRENANASGTALNTQMKVLEQKINNLQKIFINSLNRFIEYLLILLQKEGEIPKDIDIEQLKFNCYFNNFFKTEEEKEKLKEEKEDLELKIENREKEKDKLLEYFKAELLDKEEVRNRIDLINIEIKDLEEKIKELKENFKMF